MVFFFGLESSRAERTAGFQQVTSKQREFGILSRLPMYEVQTPSIEPSPTRIRASPIQSEHEVHDFVAESRASNAVPHNPELFRRETTTNLTRVGPADEVWCLKATWSKVYSHVGGILTMVVQSAFGLAVLRLLIPIFHRSNDVHPSWMVYRDGELSKWLPNGQIRSSLPSGASWWDLEVNKGDDEFEIFPPKKKR
ncbi:hypothetical protein DL98DRAFT_582347 [Cadophora sp. DSE1049]|nr:hypothetical protein DL98DRAFT_582347 [Cadophora sp. DSE1049]